MSDAVLGSIADLVAARFGLVFNEESVWRLAAAVESRSATQGGLDAAPYLALLERDQGEQRALAERLTVHETYFFREPEQLRFIADTLVVRMLARRTPGEPVRILSAGCSSGEEPYSLAIALRERHGERAAELFSITAGDLSRPMLERARQGHYSAFSFRGIDPVLHARHFTANGGHYQVRDDVRAMVEFFDLNLLAPEFPPGRTPFDLVLMRNVSIYFDRDTRTRILAALAASMRPGAVLITGATETLANDLGIFDLTEESGLFHFVHNAPLPGGQVARTRGLSASAGGHPGNAGRLPLPRVDTATAPAVMPAAHPLTAPLAASAAPSPRASITPILRTSHSAAAGKQSVPTLEALLELVHAEHYEQAAPLLTARLQTLPADDAARLLLAYVKLNRNALDEARAAALEVLNHDAWSVDAHYLLGLIDKWRGEAQSAVDWFKKATYLNRNCWPAHFHLGNLYANAGEQAAARRAWRVVLQLLEGDPAPGIVIVPIGLRMTEVRFLCERRLAATPQPSGQES